jgi:guanylate kinase
MKRHLQLVFGAETAPKFTTRPSRGTAEDRADFIFCDKDIFPRDDVLPFVSYGYLFGIQLKPIEQSMSRSRDHVVVGGDPAVAEALSDMFPDRIVSIFIYCNKDVLKKRMDDAGRSSRWPTVVEELHEIYASIGCVQYVVNNSHSLPSAHRQIDRVVKMLRT